MDDANGKDWAAAKMNGQTMVSSWMMQDKSVCGTDSQSFEADSSKSWNNDIHSRPKLAFVFWTFFGNSSNSREGFVALWKSGIIVFKTGTDC